MGSTTGKVTVTAKKLLADAVKNSGRHTTVQLPEEFARVQSAEQEGTHLSQLFGQGEAAMKLYLTLLLLTRKEPHELFRIVPDHYWAELFGYEELNDADPIPGSGTRRIKRAMRSLQSIQVADQPLIARTTIPGKGVQISVTHPPGVVRAPYITIPVELWSRGWINVMSARALFVYLCLRLALPGKPDATGVHVSPWDRERFAMKDDTWQRAVKELEKLNLVRTDVSRVATDRWTTDLKLRKVYYLNNSVLTESDSPLLPVVI